MPNVVGLHGWKWNGSRSIKNESAMSLCLSFVWTNLVAIFFVHTCCLAIEPENKCFSFYPSPPNRFDFVHHAALKTLACAMKVAYCLATSLLPTSPGFAGFRAIDPGFAKTSLGCALHKKTEHFTFFCASADQKMVDDLASGAEAGFEKVSKDLDHVYPQNVAVEVYPSMQALHAVFKNMPTFSSGCLNSVRHTIYVAPLDNLAPEKIVPDMVDTVVHELSHLFISDKSKGNFVPKWLHEGIAVYESKPRFSANKWRMRFANNHSEIPLRNRLERPGNEEFGTAEYACAYWLVDFIKEKWGQPTLLALMQDYASFEKILGRSWQAFCDQWFVFLSAGAFNQNG